jgi:hypothetical protein
MGAWSSKILNSNGVAALGNFMIQATTPLGLTKIGNRLPRAARSSQPLGFEPESRWYSGETSGFINPKRIVTQSP